MWILNLEPDLDYGVQEGHTIQQGLPHGQVADVQLVLRDACECAFQASTHTLRRVIGELDGGLLARGKNRDKSQKGRQTGDHIQLHLHMFVNVLYMKKNFK